MAYPTGEAELGPLRLDFDRSVKVEFRGAAISSDGGLLLHRELDDALGLTELAADLIADTRTGHNGRHRLAGFLRQSIYSRLAGYEDVNDIARKVAFGCFSVTGGKQNGECRLTTDSST